MKVKNDTITLRLWVSNQYGDYDMSDEYLDAAVWSPPSSVVLDREECTLSGSTRDIWAALRDLGRAVAEAGHGDDAVDDAIGPPCLTGEPINSSDTSHLVRRKWHEV